MVATSIQINNDGKLYEIPSIDVKYENFKKFCDDVIPKRDGDPSDLVNLQIKFSCKDPQEQIDLANYINSLADDVTLSYWCDICNNSINHEDIIKHQECEYCNNNIDICAICNDIQLANNLPNCSFCPK